MTELHDITKINLTNINVDKAYFLLRSFYKPKVYTDRIVSSTFPLFYPAAYTQQKPPQSEEQCNIFWITRFVFQLFPLMLEASSELAISLTPYLPHSISLVWIPGHKGIPSNETDDNLTRLATDEGSLLNIKPPHTDIWAANLPQYLLKTLNN